MSKQAVKEPLPTRDILNALSYAKPVVAKLKGLGKDYSSLIDEILTLGEDDIPTSKALQQKLNVKPAKLKLWLQELHSDFIAFIQSESTPMSFQTTRVAFSVIGSKEHLYFYAQLAFIPRIGEMVNFPFLHTIFGYDIFYVNSVTHDYKGDEIEVNIHISTLEPFVENLKQRALFEQELDYFSVANMSTSEIITFLRKQYGPTSGGQAARIRPGHPLWRKEWEKNK